MLSLTIPKNRLAAWSKFFAAALLASVAALSIRDAHISAQDFPAVLGRIEGDDLEVVTKTPSGIETDAAPTVVASGSDVTLRSGRALLLLNAGGEIDICGPAHFKLIQSSGAVTLALDYGRVHPSLESAADGFTIYTPTIVATSIAISGGPRDMTVGLEQSGAMCVLTTRGAMRVQPQFSDQGMIIPQGGTVNLVEGQIESLHADASACSCDYPRAHLETPKSAPTPRSQSDREVSALARPLTPERKKTQSSALTPSAAADEPVYTVLMPPLSFDAKSPEPPPDPAPETILLVREVRLRPTVEFRGHVNPEPAPEAAPPVPVAATTTSDNQPSQSKPGFFDRVRTFFRRLTTTNPRPCAGAGCKG